MPARYSYAQIFCRYARPLFERDLPLETRAEIIRALKLRRAKSSARFGEVNPDVLGPEQALRAYEAGPRGALRMAKAAFGRDGGTLATLRAEAALDAEQRRIRMGNHHIVAICEIFLYNATDILANEAAVRGMAAEMAAIPDPQARAAAIEAALRYPPQTGKTDMRDIWDGDFVMRRLLDVPGVKDALGPLAFRSIS